MRKLLFPLLSCLIVCTSYGVPVLVIALLALRVRGPITICALCLTIPILTAVLFALVAGLWSVPFQRHIVPGKFPRDISHPVYFGRRVYGLCWTVLYYCTPVYFLCLSFTPLKWMTFRLFGYRGSMNFAVYPDTWIRDLPLLSFGEGAYLSNKATLGTNIALSNGNILVDRITLKSNAYLGHLSMVAPGVTIGDSAEVSVGCAIGIKAVLGEQCRIGPGSSVGHGAKVSAQVVTGAMCCIGSGATIADGIVLPNSTSVPNRTWLQHQKNVTNVAVGKQALTTLRAVAPHVAQNAAGSED